MTPTCALTVKPLGDDYRSWRAPWMEAGDARCGLEVISGLELLSGQHIPDC